MKILNLDIELVPAQVFVWDLKVSGGYIPPDRIIVPKGLLCFAGKWVGDDDVYFFSSWDDGHEAMVHQIWNLVDQADAVLHYNGTRFDIPYLNTEFVKLQLSPPSPYQHIDLYKAAKKHFAFMSNSLDYVSRTLGTAQKIRNSGFSLWTRALDGDAQAQREMEEYNTGDIFANEDLYARLLPWIPSHPSYAVIDGENGGLTCPQCGSASVEPSGRTYTATSAYPRYKCLGCGKWLRGSHRLTGSELRAIS
jgi:DNA-directed RNA polymerase subunit RPC12/RpoP